MATRAIGGAETRDGTRPLWVPGPERVAASNLARFVARYRPGAAGPGGAVAGEHYADLWRWSVERPEEFWPAVWEFCGVIAEPRPDGPPWEAVLEGRDRMAPPHPVKGPRWFRGARLNFAENLLRSADDREALVGWNERGRRGALTRAQLAREVRRWRTALAASGIGPGDRVAGYLPNTPEAVIAMLAATSLGAIWSASSPDFGDAAIRNAFGQIQPRLLFATDTFHFGGEDRPVLDRVTAIARGLPAIERVVIVPYEDPGAPRHAPPGVPGGEWLEEWLARGEKNGFGAAAGNEPSPRFDFDHPAFILFSSGTTGLPKPIVHGAGGTLLQHLKELVLHTDLHPGDRIVYYTTCAWMMWNWLVSSLATGATVVLYDGSPLPAQKDLLWRLAAEERITHFGTSARWLALNEKAGLEPARDHDLSALRTVLSTGSPLAPQSFDWVGGHVGGDIHLASISGGTDLVSCFVLGNPTAPVWRGEIQCRGLGMAVDVFGPDGRPLPPGVAGELVCTRPFPSMPVRFWEDPGGTRYRSSYFDVFPGAWRHGDWAERTEHDGMVIHGRSDSTLNPGGVRIGTAEIYRPLGRIPEVLESIAVGQDWDGDQRVVLFVRLREGAALDDALRERIRREIAAGATRHHVPRRIVQVPDLPRTVNGKLSESAVRAVLHGRPVVNEGALANPRALEHFKDLPELRT